MPSAAGDQSGEAPLVKATDLHRSYGATVAVDGVSFELRRGEILGFLGPNGAGKSTTLKILTGTIAADSGSALISGINIEESPLEARKRFGYLPESLPFYWEMSVGDYLRFIGKARGLGGDHLRRRVDEVIDLLGLGRMRWRTTGALSKGFRQRVGLAQALIHDPEILILDEPTNGLDPQQIIEVRALIQNLANTRAIIFSTHILQEIAEICTRIMVIHSGKLVADAKPGELSGETSDGWEVVISGADISGTDWRRLSLEKAGSIRGGEHLLTYRGSGTPDIRAIEAAARETSATLLEVRRPRKTLESAYLELTGMAAKGRGGGR